MLFETDKIQDAYDLRLSQLVKVAQNGFWFNVYPSPKVPIGTILTHPSLTVVQRLRALREELRLRVFAHYSLTKRDVVAHFWLFLHCLLAGKHSLELLPSLAETRLQEKDSLAPVYHLYTGITDDGTIEPPKDLSTEQQKQWRTSHFPPWVVSVFKKDS